MSHFKPDFLQTEIGLDPNSANNISATFTDMNESQIRILASGQDPITIYVHQPDSRQQIQTAFICLGATQALTKN